MGKEGGGVVEKEGGDWEGRLCEEIEKEGVDVQVVQKLPAEVAAATDEEERVEVEVVWGKRGGRKPS